MKNVIIFHGLNTKQEYFDPNQPAPGNAHWLPWLQKQLLMKDIYAETPVAIDSYRPSYDKWKNAFERCLKIDSETILVGHSCGAGFIVRWLSENKNVTVGKVVLVAPWLNPGNKDGYDMGDFFDFEIDPDLASRTETFQIFVSDDDFPTIIETVELIEASVAGTKARHFSGKKHFCFEDMGTAEFPELLEALL